MLATTTIIGVPIAIVRDGRRGVAVTEVVVAETVEEAKAAADADADTNKTNTNNQSQGTRNNNVGDDGIFLIRATHLFLRIDFI